MAKISPHGMTKARGCEHASLGNFCKLFPNLKSWASDCGIKQQCEAEEIAALLGGPGGIMHDARGESGDSGIPAAYTFFAQFIDHDITLDTTTALHGTPVADIDKLPNLRTASLDLDCVYGLGPEAMPFLFDQTQAGRLLVGNKKNPANDLPRNRDGRALIGDPRNDENIYVSQMQLMFLRFHNRRIVGRSFEKAQEDARFHYQWVVLYDFLRRVCDPDVYNHALPLIEDPKAQYPYCPPLDDCDRICMPVEFSVAAYRFGHTLVRSQYPVNADYPVVELFDERFGTLGFSHVPEKLVVDWRFLLDVEPCHEYVNSKAIDHLLADEMIRLPDPVVGSSAGANDRSLAFRNLLRGYVLGLPSGQSMAKALAKGCKDGGYGKLVENCDLPFDKIEGWECIPKRTRDKLEKHTPLFLYLMLEGTASGGRHLGPVGSAILLEVFGTMLKKCSTSFLNYKGEGKHKAWCPDPCIWNPQGLKDVDPKNARLSGAEGDPCKTPAQTPKGFTLGDIARYVANPR